MLHKVSAVLPPNRSSSIVCIEGDTARQMGRRGTGHTTSMHHSSRLIVDVEGVIAGGDTPVRISSRCRLYRSSSAHSITRGHSYSTTLGACERRVGA